MPLVNLLIVLIVLGVILYLINHYVPLDPPIKMVINVIVVLVLCLWLLGILGIADLTIPIRR